MKSKISLINSNILNVTNGDCFKLFEMVYIGKNKFIGEVIEIDKNCAVIQVFEDTSGLKLDDEVYPTGELMCAELGPGIISNIFDGIQRPLISIEKESGIFISSGVRAKSLDEEKLWTVKILKKIGDSVRPGDIVAEINETELIVNKIMISPDIEGKVIDAKDNGDYKISDTILVLKNNDSNKIFEINLKQRWPIKSQRPFLKKIDAREPLITGQRVIDTLFPIAKGGVAAVPGGFGTGKTMTQHQLAKWSDADIIVYIGCGERGNEMTQVLEDFSKLKDPKSGKMLMQRTVLIANTSNMPVAAREASIYTGMTLAEYYRDMGYHVAVMADSTSRWAEALRELSGRLEEMPAEEGFPAYLASKLASFYERAGYVKNLNGTEGSISVIGAVSPQGGDLSEPVTQNTKRFVRCFWALDKNLAYARHFPAINWSMSYTEYLDDLKNWYEKNIDSDFWNCRSKILSVLNSESELLDIAKLIGVDVLPDDQKLILNIAWVIRLGFVQQNAYHNFDTCVPLEKQLNMMKVILYLHETCKKLLDLGLPVKILSNHEIFEEVINIKYKVDNDDKFFFDKYFKKIDNFYTEMSKK
ncbi:MAG: V-type ATP synthase subunit A [Clostridiales bacterium]|jgi:V/A-type H+-transporting ATPase subunit A|nr:V-type ATP synthase subunit A [Clostridiales bacterium]